jgi:PIN domain nuclease of toxin-antitoxin system
VSERVVLDSSALLAIVFGEPGAEMAAEWAAGAAGAVVSAVNLSEAAAKMNERGFADEETEAYLSALGFDLAPFGEAEAYAAGRLRAGTRALGLSFGDRACIALAQREGAAVATADRAWARLDLGLAVRVIR